MRPSAGSTATTARRPGRRSATSTAPYSRSALAGLYRSSRAALVTPLRDGMNLVAKEYVAAQDPEDPGVLILSRFAGAAVECQAALLVNPYDQEAMAAAIDQALSMPLDERRARHGSMVKVLSENDIKHWGTRFIAALTGPRRWPPCRRLARRRRPTSPRRNDRRAARRASTRASG